MPAVVAVHSLDSYDPESVAAAVHSVLEPFGGMPSLLNGYERVILKPNLLSAREPERCVTTHPAIVEAAGHEVLKAGYRVSIGDSPALRQTSPRVVSPTTSGRS